MLQNKTPLRWLSSLAPALLLLWQSHALALRLADPIEPIGPPAGFSGDVFYDRYELGTNERAENVFQQRGDISVGTALSIINGTYNISGGRLATQELILSHQPQTSSPQPWIRFGPEVIHPNGFVGWCGNGFPSHLFPNNDIFLPPAQPQIRKFHQTGGEALAQDAVILDIGSIIIDAGTFTAGEMSMSAAFQQNGGLTTFDAVQINDGNFQLTNGSFTTKSLSLGFELQRIRVQDWTPIPIDNFPISFSPIVDPATNVGVDLFFPPQPGGEFRQTSGQTLVQETVKLSGGRMTVDNGSFKASSLVINGDPSQFRATEFRQNGGTTHFESILIDNGSFVMNGGQLNAGSLVMGDPAMQAPSFNRRPAFSHSGGDVLISGNLELCIPGSLLPFDPAELFPFKSVDYQLRGGSLAVGGDLIVGSMGMAPARFQHDSGDNHVAGTIRIEGENSIYEMQKGSLIADRLHVATGVLNTGGALTMGPDSIVNINEEIVFGTDALFGAELESTLVFSGKSFSMLGSDSASMSGLDSLTLQISGGDNVSEIEVAGLDWGDIPMGFVLNFSLRSLIIGDEQAAHAKLVDLVSNRQGLAEHEALYVDTLELTAGSSLDLNGLNIYYKNLSLGDDAKIIGNAVAIPEPRTSLLGLLGIVMTLGLRQPRQQSD